MTAEQSNLQAKAVERIKKLLELAASPVESEARLAFEKAQELMAKYSLRESDWKSDSVPEAIVRHEYVLKVKPSTPLIDQLPFIAQAIGQPFGVYVLVRASERKVLLVGFSTNCTLVEYAIDCVLTQCMFDYREQFAKQRSIAFAPEFWRGVSLALSARFSAPASQDSKETALAVYDRVKKFMEQFKGSANWGNSQSDLAGGFTAGQAAGQNAQIRPALQTQSGGKLLT